MSTPKIAIIIVTFNAQRFLDDCFGSLSRMDVASMDVEVIVIDNASKDGTAARIRELMPSAIVVESPVNTGFAKGNNIGIEMALERGADYVYLLNHDTEVTPDFLHEALAAMRSDATIGSAQSLLVLSPNKHLINSAGNAVHFLGFGYCLAYTMPTSSFVAGGEPEIAYPSGAGVMLSGEALRKVGLFDETFFMYHEDLDLGWRLRLAGYKNVLATRSRIYHKYEFSRSVAKLYYMERNRFVVFAKNLRLRSLLVLAPFLAAADIALFFFAIKGGWWREKLRSWGSMLAPATWRHIMAERKKISVLRRVSDRVVADMFSSEISYQEVATPFVRRVANPLMSFTWSVLRKLIV